MLRIHFTDADLIRTRVAATADPLWEIANSLHRLQTRSGRWAHARWFRATRTRLVEAGLTRTVRTMLLPLFPRAAYFPDFLTPPEALDGLDAGLEAILATPTYRVRREVGRLVRISSPAPWMTQLTEADMRGELVRTLRGYHAAAITPFHDSIQARIDAEVAIRARLMLHDGIEAVLASLGPGIRWQRPVLHASYPEDRDLYLNGRGLLLLPSYFNWGNPVALGDATLKPVLTYALHHEPHHSALPDHLHEARTPITTLLGRTRAAVLTAAAAAATTGELARAAGVSASSVSQHTTALRNAGLILSHRHGQSVLHTLTPLGAALLRPHTPEPRGHHTRHTVA